MSIRVSIQEQDCEPRTVVLSRVPNQWEWLDVKGVEYQVLRVTHVADAKFELQAVVSVRKTVKEGT